MKKIFFIILTLLFLSFISSCTKESYCVSCISENPAGITQDIYEICSYEAKQTNTYESAYRKVQLSKGNKVVCTKYITQ